MLPVEQRLRDSSAFRRTVRSGRRAGGAAVVVHLLVADHGPDAGPDDEGAGGAREEAAPRAGFVVSKAVGNAVVRNRVRRRLRHLVKEFLSSCPSGSDLVVRALPAAAASSSAELRAELDRCLGRVRVSPAATTAAVGAGSSTGAAS